MKIQSLQRHHGSTFFSILLSLLLGGSVLMSACGGCQRAQKAWDTANEEPEAVSSGPHWLLEMRASEITRHLSSAKAEVNRNQPKLKVPSPVPRLKLGAITFQLRDLSWVVNQERGLMTVSISAHMRGQALFSLQLTGDSPLEMDPKGKKLKLAIRGDQFKRASLQLDQGADQALKLALLARIPRELRPLLPERELTKVVTRTLSMVSEEGYPLIRDGLLKPLGTLVKMSWTLPDYPITQLALEANSELWRVGLWTSIKADGLGREAMQKGIKLKNQKTSQRDSRVYISAPWLAAAGKWAMGEGLLPARFDRSGRPDEKGEAYATMTWERSGEERPFKVHLWSGPAHTAAVCLYARAGLKPKIEIQEGKLRVDARGKLERVEGDPLVETLAKLSGIGERALSWHHKRAAPAEVKIGSTPISLGWERVEITSQYLIADLSLDRESSGKRRKRRADETRHLEVKARVAQAGDRSDAMGFQVAQSLR